MTNGLAFEVKYHQGTDEECNNLPHRYEYVRKVSRKSEFIFHTAESLDDSWNYSLYTIIFMDFLRRSIPPKRKLLTDGTLNRDVILPPTTRNEKQRWWYQPERVLRTVEQWPNDETRGLSG